MNLNLLTALKALLDECHVSRAAARMNVTQSAMSKNLAQLRELFGDPLLVRSGNSLIPTTRAVELRAKLDEILRGVGDLLSAGPFEPSSCDRRFIIAATDYVVQYIFPASMEEILSEAPGMGMDLLSWNSGYLEDLCAGRIDLATYMVDDIPANVHSLRLGEDGFVCMMRERHPLAEGDISLEDYTAFPHAAITTGGDKVRVIDRELSRLGASRRIALRVPFYGSAMELCSRSNMLLTIPEHIARNLGPRFGLIYRPLPFRTDRFEYSIIWHEQFNNNPAHEWFRTRLFEGMRRSLYSH